MDVNISRPHRLVYLLFYQTGVMVNANRTFHVADYSIFAVTLVVSLGIGLYYALSGGKQRTTAEYFVGNRRMMIIPVAISLMVSFESSIMMLGTPAEVIT